VFAFGEVEEEALQEVKAAVGFWLETARREGREILAGKNAAREQMA